ncbi:hypothetical protein OIDMADRAFT_48621 [Oidiodendron maius Zn]|uniref:Uncharacterized protein n=1 Tax=Oidiodendron maius (strain Zn) TaxID=913774 RepID=A0A0C3DBR3_OIDMZ|nr:hypothetical protein OIDMADRAFT_48621 [Oidiodendron maius Zn]
MLFFSLCFLAAIDLGKTGAAILDSVNTAAPSVHEALEKRASGRTCGFINGDQDSPLTCGPGYTCNLDLMGPYIACCPSTGSCLFVEECYDYGKWESMACDLSEGPIRWTGCGSISSTCMTYHIIQSDTTDSGLQCATGVGGIIEVMTTPTGQILPSLTSSPYTPLYSSFAATSTPTSSPVTDSQNSSSHSLSTGDIIAVVSAIIGALALLIAWLTYQYMRKKKKERGPGAGEVRRHTN